MEYISKIEIPTAGGVVFLNDESATGTVSLFKESGSITSDYAISDIEVYNGKRYRIYFPGSLNLNSNIFSIFGYQLSQEEANAPGTFEVVYDDDWIVAKILTGTQSGGPSVKGTNIISGTLLGEALVDDSVDYIKLTAAGDRGKILRSGVDGVIEEHDASVAGKVLMGNNVDVVSQEITGAFTLDEFGVATLGAQVIERENLNFEISSPLQETIVIASADVLTLNSAPITVLPNPGNDQYIEVISASASMIFNTKDYKTNTILELISDGADIAQYNNTSILPTTVDKFGTTFVPVATVAAGETQILKNAGLQIKVNGGDPTFGDSDLKVDIQYRIITP